MTKDEEQFEYYKCYLSLQSPFQPLVLYVEGEACEGRTGKVDVAAMN